MATLSLKQFQSQRKEMSVQSWCDKYRMLDVEDFVNEYRAKQNQNCVKIHDYDGFYIEETEGSKLPFAVVYDRSYISFKTLEQAENEFWDNFAKDELFHNSISDYDITFGTYGRFSKILSALMHKGKENLTKREQDFMAIIVPLMNRVAW